MLNLRNSLCRVVFTKADGTEREMFCTQDFNVIPKENHPESKEWLKEDTGEEKDLMKVFDLDIYEWRSFKPSRVIEMEFYEWDSPDIPPVKQNG